MPDIAVCLIYLPKYPQCEYNVQNSTQKLILRFTGRWLINQISKAKRRGDGGREQGRDEQTAFPNLLPEPGGTGAAHPSHTARFPSSLMSKPPLEPPHLQWCPCPWPGRGDKVPVSPAQHPPAPAASTEMSR